MPAPLPKPVMLVILDGWGWREEEADNAGELLSLPDVDGALVGGASLEVDSFAALVEAAQAVAAPS